MSWSFASASMPMASTCLARVFSSGPKPSVSSGSTSSRRNVSPLLTRNGRDSLRDFLMMDLSRMALRPTVSLGGRFASPLTDLGGVLTIVLRADTIEQFPGRCAWGEVLVAQGSGRRHQPAVTRLEIGEDLPGRRVLARIHEPGVPCVVVVIRACRIRRLAPLDPGERRSHLPVPAHDVDENLPDAPRAQPYRPTLSLVETAHGLP